MFFYKIVNGLAPSYLSDIFPPQREEEEEEEERRRERDLLTVFPFVELSVTALLSSLSV